jgi:phosphate transport system substrate-binding protein
MKKITMITALMLFGVFAFGQQKETGEVKVRGTRLTYPLVKKWIEGFNKEYPNIKVSIAPNAPEDSIDFTLAAYELSETDVNETQKSLVVTRYVQLPVVNSNRPGLTELQSRGVKEKDLQDLFFTPTTPSFLASSQAQSQLYVRDRPVCAVKAFAAHYGNDPKKINGTGIKGDDQDLAEAVKNDVNGISFNNLGFIYDVKTRKVQNGLAVLPLDLNENGKVDKEEEIYGTLDEVIEYVEKTKNPKFVNEHVNFVFKKDAKNVAAARFLNWVLTNGQQYNHQLGFVNLENKFLNVQKNIFKSSFKVSSTSSCEGTDEVMSERKSRLVSR